MSGSPLETALDAIQPLAGTGWRQRFLDAIEECRRIQRLKLAPEATAPDAPLLAVIAGGTNVGKSTLFNALAGREISRATPIARGTKAAVLLVHERAGEAFRRGGFLPGYERRPITVPDDANDERSAGVLLLATHARDDLAPVAIADSPDIDSVFGRNKRVAWDVLYAADAVVIVASEEKYNDEACVAFLERALRHGKTVLAVLNKSGAPEAEADFRDKVVPGAAARAGVPAPRVVTIPYGREVAPRAVAEALHSWAAGPGPIRERALEGARRALREEAAPALDLLRREAETLAHHREAVRAAAAGAVTAYRTGLVSLPIFEFERVFRLLADALKVPVIDDFYDRLRAAGAPLASALRRAIGLGDPQSAATKQIAERDRRDLEAARVRLGEALAAVRALPDRYPPEMADALRAAMLPAAEADKLREIDGAYAATLSQEAERWVDGVLRELHARLRDNPGAVAAGKTLKGILRVAFAGGAILVGGHVGFEDLIVAPIVDLMVKFGVEKVVDRAYFAQKRDEFYAGRAAAFAKLVEERTVRLALGGIQGGATPAAIAALEAALPK